MLLSFLSVSRKRRRIFCFSRFHDDVMKYSHLHHYLLPLPLNVLHVQPFLPTLYCQFLVFLVPRNNAKHSVFIQHCFITKIINVFFSFLFFWIIKVKKKQSLNVIENTRLAIKFIRLYSRNNDLEWHCVTGRCTRLKRRSQCTS